MIAILLYMFAFVFFVCAALGVPSSRFNLIGAGLAFWVFASHLLSVIHG